MFVAKREQTLSMGTKLCIHAPPDGEEGGRPRNHSDSNSERGTAIQRLQRTVALQTKLNSTDFQCDPTETFRPNIANYCRRKRLPPLHEMHRFNFYIWSSQKFGFGHDSIVIGSRDSLSNDYGFITVELCVDVDELTVFPNTRYLSKFEAAPFVEGGRWKYQFSYQTTLDSLIALVLDLIRNHGRYSNLHNGCQHFVEAFLQKIVGAEHLRRITAKLDDNALYRRSKRQSVRGFLRYLAHDAAARELRAEGLCSKYETMESTLQIGGALLVLPVIAMAISKEMVKSQRHRVHFHRGLKLPTEGLEDAHCAGTEGMDCGRRLTRGSMTRGSSASVSSTNQADTIWARWTAATWAENAREGTAQQIQSNPT